MKQRYDFSKGERQKFYKPGVVFRLPVHLDEKVERYLAAQAEAKGAELSERVNELRKKNIELIEAGAGAKRTKPARGGFDGEAVPGFNSL